MPIDPTEPSPTTTGTDRRAFLTRSAAGGALVATVAGSGLAGGLALLGTAASAQEGAPPTVEQEFAAAAAPLELAASLAYQAALAGGTVGEEWTPILRRFQRNHQEVAEALTGALHPDADAPLADAAVATRFSPPAGADEAAILPLLASLEEALAATHLTAIGTFDDASFAKTIAQALAVEEQQAVALGRAAGADIEALTPATAPTDGALEPGEPVPSGTDAGDAQAEDEGTGTGTQGDEGGTDGPGGSEGGTDSETGDTDTDTDGGATGGSDTGGTSGSDTDPAPDSGADGDN